MRTLETQQESGRFFLPKLFRIRRKAGVLGILVTLLCIASLLGVTVFFLTETTVSSKWVRWFSCHTECRMADKSCLLEDATPPPDQGDFFDDDIPSTRTFTTSKRNTRAWLSMPRNHHPVFLTDYWINPLVGFVEFFFLPAERQGSLSEFPTRANPPWWLIHLPFYNPT